MECGRVRLYLAGLGVVLATAACGSSNASGSGADSARQAAADASVRLEGSWVLTEFQPEATLEPMLAALLAAQLKELRVTFHAGSMKVQGVGVNAERTYRVTQAAADGFSLTVTDPTSVEYRVTGAFEGTTVSFVSLSDPWRGRGRLQRAP
jgi:hypothetical protein